MPADTIAHCNNEMLPVVQDESSMERIIKAYLADVHKLVVEEKYGKEADKVMERGVLLNLYTSIKVPEGKRGGVLGVINDFNRRKAFCSVYIDTDGEVICR